MKQGHPSSAVPGAIGVSLQTGENRPVASQLPVRRALRKIGRLRPVRYRNWTATVAMDASARRDSSLQHEHRQRLRLTNRLIV